jgi:hypothetical protein
MSTQINNAINTEITPTFETLHYVYASSKSPSGYVISKKQLKGKDAVWCAPSEDQCQHWILNQGLTVGTSTRYNDKDTTQENVMNIESMSLQELASLQLRIATRIQQLLSSDNNANTASMQHEEVEQVQPQDVAESSIETKETEPSNAAVEEAVEAAPIKRKIKSKKSINVEAVAAKIETTLCVMSRDEAKAYIKEWRLPIKSNMSCEALNDAINAFNQGGVEAVPVEYLTKAAATKMTTNKAKEVAMAPVKKTVLKKSKSNEVR